jgi:hypothetical protein
VTTETEPIPVRVGQVWADNDKRSTGRHVRVVEVREKHAVVELVAQRGRAWSGLRSGEAQRAKPGRRTMIRLERFKPNSTGYRLIEDASDGAA